VQTIILTEDNVSKYAQGVKQCLEDGFGPIPADEETVERILLSKIKAGHIIVAIIGGYTELQVMATATGFIEEKLIHAGDPKYSCVDGASRVLHIEDVCTRKDYRGMGCGSLCLEALEDLAEVEGAYKIL
jgi:GNAT superfamily N-acetyltransferase